jgi:hypothetical protein
MQPSREKALWSSVLGQAILDALGRSSYNRAEYRRDGDPRLEARQWIEQGGPDFEAVCQLAGVCPDAVRERVLAGDVGPLYLGAESRKRTPKVQGRAA